MIDRSASVESLLAPTDTFARRHLGATESEIAEMLDSIGAESMDQLIGQTIPAAIRFDRELQLETLESDQELGEHGLLERLRALAGRNRVLRSYLGMGYSGCLVPAVIQRNVLENPAWYTQYTPYQSEISQGRLEALLNFQTMICDLTGLPVANASLLDEGTAAAEAMSVCHAAARGKRPAFFAAEDCHPQTLAVLETRAAGLGIELRVGPADELDFANGELSGLLLQYPATDGRIHDYRALIQGARQAGVKVVMAADLLALVLLRSPGELEADICVGSSQRFGVPLGFGGPHAAFFAITEALKRQLPGRIIGLSKDRHGNPALRMALQTREQHIRREKATSNICTAQVLLAIMAGMYAVYHGPRGLRRIARRVHAMTAGLAEGLRRLDFELPAEPFFDTVRVGVGAGRADQVIGRALERGINLRRLDGDTVAVAFDETVEPADLDDVLAIFAQTAGHELPAATELLRTTDLEFDQTHTRATDFLEHPVFERYHTEHELLRYIHRLASRDLSLTTSMISLGSCTMKLNATSEMLPVSWPEWAALHPFAPAAQTEGYSELFRTLESWLAEITGFSTVSLQPNAGSQGEYAGLMVIRAYHVSRGEAHRNVCLIPVSAHGTNPASAVMAGLRVVTVACEEGGDIDLGDLKTKAAEHSDRLAALMITYPSTHGVFEENVGEVCEVIHHHGGQVYLDGANMNAQVGLCRPGDFGADVCHLNLHKTFCIPHGGGGPGMGPICMVEHLAPFAPGHPLAEVGGEAAMGAIAAAPWGSPSILPISWVYIALMGNRGLRRASELAILNANYMAGRLAEHFPILFRGARGRVAHEFILDLRPFKKSARIEAEDVAKRLMDFGFHAPTMSWPVAGTLMIEPTESESRAELDRFCDAMIQIRGEIREIEQGRFDTADNPLKNAPHTAAEVTADDWHHPYSRQQAAFPAAWVREAKFWPHVGRVDNAFGDRNLICSCPPIESYSES